MTLRCVIYVVIARERHCYALRYDERKMRRCVIAAGLICRQLTMSLLFRCAALFLSPRDMRDMPRDVTAWLLRYA